MNEKAHTPAEEYKAAMVLKEKLQELAIPFDKQAAIAMVAAVLLVGETPGIQAKRGKVINVMTAEFRRMLQSYLP
jgi:hypothetical protein